MCCVGIPACGDSLLEPHSVGECRIDVCEVEPPGNHGHHEDDSREERGEPEQRLSQELYINHDSHSGTGSTMYRFAL